MQLRLTNIYCFIFLLLSQVLLSQTDQHTIDSLQKLLKSAKNDTTKCKLLNDLIEAESDDAKWPIYNEQMAALAEANLKRCPSSDPLHKFYLRHLADATNNKGYLSNLQGRVKEAISYFESALEMEERAGNPAGLISSLNNVGTLYQSQGDIQKALTFFRRSLQLSEQLTDKRGMAESYNNIGRIYDEQGDIPAAIDFFLKSLKLKQEIQDKKGMAIALNNLGAIYNKQGDTTRALHYYNRSLVIQKEIGDQIGYAGSLHNMAHVYFVQGKKDLALATFNNAYVFAEKNDDLAGMAHCLNSLGMIYLSKGDLRPALNYYSRGYSIFESINDKQSLALTMNRMAIILFKLNQKSEAKQYAEKSLKLAQELGFPDDIRTASGSLSEFYAISGDWKKAYEMLSLNKRMNDSLSNEASQKAALEKTFQFEYEKKAVADSIKAVEEHKVFEAQIKQEKTQRMALYCGIGLLAVFAVFMYNRFRVTQQQKHLIEIKEQETQQQKNIIEEKHKEISDSINYAERIQRSFLATDALLNKHLKDYFIFFQPKATVSGDFYWAAELNNDQFAFVVADSTGHGVPGAIMSLLNITSLEKAIEVSSEPAPILNHTREIIITRLKKDGSVDGGKDGMDASLLIFDFSTSMVQYAAANNPIWIVRNKQLLEFGADKMPVGKHDHDQQSFAQHSISLEKGDVVYAFTDGLPDQFGGPKGKKFMYKQLKELLLANAHLPMQDQSRALNDALQQWKGSAEQVDDITVVGIRV